MALTSSVWPLNCLIGLGDPSLQTNMEWSMDDVAKLSSSRQSTSRVGPVWNANRSSTSPVCALHAIAVLSTLPLSSAVPFLFHFSEKIGPSCASRENKSSPSPFHTRAIPSYDPVANKLPSKFQSNVVTSLLLFAQSSIPSFFRSGEFRLVLSSAFSLVPFEVPLASSLSPLSPWLLPFFASCFSTSGALTAFPETRPLGPAGTVHTRAVASPPPLARRSAVGDHAQMKTSAVWPSNTDISSFGVFWMSSFLCFLSSSISMDETPGPSFASRVIFSFSFRSSSRRAASRSESLIDLFVFTRCFKSSTGLLNRSEEVNMLKLLSTSVPSSLRFASNSRYCRPFWMKDTRAPGGSSTPFATDVSVEKDSFPKTNAACVNPDSSIYRYTRKFTSSLEMDISAETRTTPTITPPDT
mmetsp:Transcript_4615/g.15356  ORF Transcript_4615/g.15356 Transcript_4615/m.15356 type:complete len:412 (+) Transcript_4615:2796-4031(+)